MARLRHGDGSGWARPSRQHRWWQGRGDGWWVDPCIDSVGYGLGCAWCGCGAGVFPGMMWLRSC
jgi:hypothetical protein